MVTRRALCTWLGATVIVGCTHKGSVLGATQGATPGATALTYETFDPDFLSVVDTTSNGELLSDGYQWAEGPAWDAKNQSLYFTDVPANRAYKWQASTGTQLFLDPSGASSADGFREAGANGLLVSGDGQLLLCNHGSRSIESMDIQTGKRTTLVDRFEGQKFNSPNDLIEASDGTIYFTDPPYGLEGLDDSPLKEMAVNGVYKRDPDGKVERIIADMTLPNGVILSPDEKYLYVSQSDPSQALVRRYRLADMQQSASPWFDASPFMSGHQGLPDGMAISTSGYVFVAGPGGILVVNDAGKCLGRIATGRATANCAFGEDGRTLFITAQNQLYRVRTLAKGSGRF